MVDLYDVEYQPYDVTHVLVQFQLLIFAALAFVLLHRWGVYPVEIRSVILDVEWFYRHLFPRLLKSTFNYMWALDAVMRRWIVNKLDEFFLYLNQNSVPGGGLSRMHPTGSMVMWVIVLLGFYLIVSFI